MTNAWLIRHYALMLVLASIVCVEVTAGSIDVSDARMPLQPGVASVYAGYFTLQNHSHQTITLVGVSSLVFSSIEIHESKLTDGVFSMRRLTEISIKPHQVVEFKPAGLHLMMRNMASEKILGDSFPVTLTFSNGDALEFHMQVSDDPAMRPTRHMHRHDNRIDI